MKLTFFYNFSFLKKTLLLVLVPVVIFLIVCLICLGIYSKRKNNQETDDYNYVFAFWINLCNVLIGISLVAVTMAFSATMIYKIHVNNKIILFILYALPLLPILFLIRVVYRFICVVLSKKPQVKESIFTENKPLTSQFDLPLKNEEETKPLEKAVEVKTELNNTSFVEVLDNSDNIEVLDVNDND